MSSLKRYQHTLLICLTAMLAVWLFFKRLH